MKIKTLVTCVALAVCTLPFVTHATASMKRFPAHPTMKDVRQRVPDWFGFVRLGRCEQPGNGKWGVDWGNQGPTYGGGLGIYRGTWLSVGSPYTVWSGSIPETLLVADAVRDRYGITAWGAHACFRG